ncbi:MAG: ATPase domain protein [Schlesneria sp.]|nr:ATPase domain protein [Schlesneria sp.]
MEDLTASARMGRLPPLVALSPPTLLEETIRALYRKTRRHVLVTGPKGVGKTTFVRELACAAATGQIPFLQEKRFVWIDCQYVSREDSRACLESILQFTLGQRNLVLCLDGLSSLLRRSGGEDNKALLKAAFARPGLQIVAVLSKWEYNDLIGSDAELLEYFTRIELEEPHGDLLSQIVQQIAHTLEAEFQLQITEATVERTLALCTGYILNEHFPAKAARVLRHVCEDLDFDRTQHGIAVSEVTLQKVIEVVAITTGIPETTLLGEADQPDFEAALSSEVFGQEEAVAAVASELRLIRAGLVDPNKPATVLLFAGMTGVGKTELAKRLAELYSTSRRLQTYPMGNFTEPHSVSGIIGVPPGYVGHDQGGRLVNDLNSDPYSVFLLDEGEKAHPNIWVPFLNLFDEGWLIDQRGRKAYADRAIFVLTTNAGADPISQMSNAGHSQQEIETRVKSMLAKIRHERSSQPVFTAQFLARIRKVIVFRPLDENAMLAICRRLVAVLQDSWKKRRDKEIEISEEVTRAIALCGHDLNQKSNGREGGRIIRKLLSEHVESRIQAAAVQNSEAYKSSLRIKVAIKQIPGEPVAGIVRPFDIAFEH